MSSSSSSPSVPSDSSLLNECRLHCDVLSIVKASQLGNGVRHNDYERYRAYLSRRLHRLRVSTKLTNARTHRDFKYKSLEVKQVNDDRHLLIPLMLSERSWAYAMSLKNQMDLNKDLKRKRFHRIKRLTRAAFWAKHLYELCLAKADSRTQLEATAYYYYQSGSLHLARDEHGDAYGDFLKSKHVFDQLKTVAITSVQSLCEERVAQLEPILRFCKYMAEKANKDKSAVDAGLFHLPPEITDLISAKLEEAVADQRAKQSTVLEQVNWNGKIINVANEKLRLLIAQTESLAKDIQQLTPSSESEQKSSITADDGDNEGSAEDKPRLQLYGQLITLYDDCSQIIRDDLREIKADGPLKTKVLLLHQYIQCSKLERVLSRNQLLAWALRKKLSDQDKKENVNKIKRKTRPDELVILFDKLIQNATELIDIAKQTANVSLEKENNARIAIFQSFRCFYVAECCRRTGRFHEAAALYQRTEQRINDITPLSSIPADENELFSNELKELSKESQSLRLVVHATGVLEETDKEMKSSNTSKRSSLPSLSSRSQTFSSGSESDYYHLVDFPPSLAVAPSKPILFDLAFNAIQYPDIASQPKNVKSSNPASTEQKQSVAHSIPNKKPSTTPSPSVSSSKDQTQTGGGFLSRWWGGGK